MVIFVEWHRTAVDQRRSRSLPMTGEDTGLGALASPLAGYLGKVHERAASLDYCPWCTSKGLTYALRSYHINLQESITLCTNPQCLFPLVSRPLEDVLASLDPVEPTVGNKRKNAFTVEKDEVITPSPKRLRSSEPDGLGPQNGTDTHLSPAEHGAVNGQHAATKTDSGKVNGYPSDCPVAETTGWKDEDVQKGKPENAACTDGLASPTALAGHLQSSSEALSTDDGDEPVLSPHHDTSEAVEDFGQLKSTPELLNKHCSLDSNQSSFTNVDIYSTEIKTPPPQQNEQTARTEQKSMTVDITTRTDIVGIKSETEDLSSTSLMESQELESVLSPPFWRNSDSLCWLDALLVALVNCKSLKTCQPKDEPQCSSVWQLIKGYEDACAAIQAHRRQTGEDGVLRVPNHVLEKANSDLQSLRMSLFKLLQPKLRCKLGQRETPVFAMPLVLTMDSWAESLFQSTFHWELKCSGCKTSTKERATKTLPTFTNIVPDWHPLHAVHLAPCNVCHKANQSRTLTLERVPPVFALHFVEGLPDNDVTIYTFNFKGKCYSVTTVIQYNQHLKHFVTWICQSDGSWLEFDDLKHPDCKTHLKLPVPAQEMHIVFWEAEEDKEPSACSPSSTFAECLPSKHGMNGTNLIADEQLSCTPDQSLLISQNDTDIDCVLSGDSSNVMDTMVTAGVDTSIGSTTLLDTFEGLTHSDIITLTLVELKEDSETQPLNDNEHTQGPRVPSRNETPDSSSVMLDSQVSHGHDVDFPSTSNSSEPESGDGSSSDPTFVPDTRRGRGRGRAVAKNQTVSKQQKGKKAARTKTAPPVSPPVSSELSNNSKKPVDAAVQENTPPVETTQQLSPESSTDTNSPMMQPSLDQNARWSFLLSKHPLNHVHTSIAKLPPTLTPTPTSVTQIKPTLPTHSTPNPVRRQQTPATLFPKPQLRMEESDGLPLKAAEMYGAFGSTNSNTPSQLPSPALLNNKSNFCQPISSDRQKPLRNTTAMSGTSLPALGVKKFPEICSSKKQSHQTSKLPPGLSDTEALRYKLMKKLKAKKKKLAKLNELLGHQGGASRPDSTDVGSPNTVTSSTYDGSNCDEILSDLLSPATTASNLSPDSTGFLEMLVNGQDGVDHLGCGVYGTHEGSQTNTVVNRPDTENVLDDFLSQPVTQLPTQMETEVLGAFELYF